LLATLISAGATCFAALFLGQAALRACGAREWSWLAPTVGLSLMMLITAPAIHVPGRTTTLAVLLVLLVGAAAVWCLSSPEHRPPPSGLLAVLPVAFAVQIPFIAAGHAGIQGAGFNNDMAAHLMWAEVFVERGVSNVTPLPLDYPLGPHSSAAVLAGGLGVGIEHSFTGWAMALPVIGAWTALALVREAAWPGKVAIATVVGMPFLIAAYYGEGAFKEVAQAILVLSFALFLGGYGPPLGRSGRYVPAAIVVGGMLSVYSVAGLPWPLAIGFLWLAVELARLRPGLRRYVSALRSQLKPIAVAAGIAVLLLVPQLPRIANFALGRGGASATGVNPDAHGNLINALPVWEAFGVWGSADFRLEGVAFPTYFAVALVAFGVVWCISRRRFLLPVAALATLALWVVSSMTRGSYVNAKALVIASPILLALAIVPLVERGPDRIRRLWPLAPVAGFALVVAVATSDLSALRFSQVGGTADKDQLRELRSRIVGGKTLFLGSDDFIRWELAGVRLSATTSVEVPAPIRPEKEWKLDDRFDFDSVDATTLNTFDWVVITGRGSGSEPPPQMTLVARSGGYSLWRRIGMVEERSILREGDAPAAILDCETPEGRAVVTGGGIAAVRRPSIETTLPPVFAGETAKAQLDLPSGRWSLDLQYSSNLALEVYVDGAEVGLEPNLARIGGLWPLGRIDVLHRRPLVVTFRADDPPWVADTTAALMGKLVATPTGPDRVVQVGEACGREVDWYRPAAP